MAEAKSNTDKKATDSESEVWSYPHIQTEEKVNLTMEALVTKSPEEEQAPDEAKAKPAEKPAEKKEDDLLQQKVNFIDQLAQQIPVQLEQVNADFMSKIVTLVKKITHQVILKEITEDEAVLKKMLDEATPLIAKKGKACTIYVSGDDLPLIESYAKDLEHTTIQADKTLSKGDFRIETEYNELEAVIEERLTNLFGLAQ